MHLVPTIILMLAILASSASAQIDLPSKGGRQALPGRPAIQPVGADRTSGSAKESEKPALVCTICGLKKTDEAIQGISVTGLQEAYCKRCQAEQLHRIPDRSKASGKIRGAWICQDAGDRGQFRREGNRKVLRFTGHPRGESARCRPCGFCRGRTAPAYR